MNVPTAMLHILKIQVQICKRFLKLLDLQGFVFENVVMFFLVNKKKNLKTNVAKNNRVRKQNESIIV